MPKFNGQRKKSINPKYFLIEGAMEAVFPAAERAAEMDILSYFPQPDPKELESGMLQRQMSSGKTPSIWELRDYLLYSGQDKLTSGMDYRSFRKTPVPEKFLQGLRIDLSSVKTLHQAGSDRWPLPGVDLTNYIVMKMEKEGTLKFVGNNTVSITPKGAQRFLDIMKDQHGVTQGGKSADPDYDPESEDSYKSKWEQFVNESVEESLVRKSETPMRKQGDLEIVQQMSHEIKNMLKDLNPRELELARFKINNVLKTMSEDNISEEAIAKIMEIMDTTINELSGGD